MILFFTFNTIVDYFYKWITITNHFKPSVWLRLLYDYICIKKKKVSQN